MDTTTNTPTPTLTHSVTLYAPDGTTFEAPVFSMISPALHRKYAKLKREFTDTALGNLKNGQMILTLRGIEDEESRQKFIVSHYEEYIKAIAEMEHANIETDYEITMKLIPMIIDTTNLSVEQKMWIESPSDGAFWSDMQKDFNALRGAVRFFRAIAGA